MEKRMLKEKLCGKKVDEINKVAVLISKNCLFGNRGYKGDDRAINQGPNSRQEPRLIFY
jgi:hypothetical protein